MTMTDKHNAQYYRKNYVKKWGFWDRIEFFQNCKWRWSNWFRKTKIEYKRYKRSRKANQKILLGNFGEHHGYLTKVCNAAKAGSKRGSGKIILAYRISSHKHRITSMTLKPEQARNSKYETYQKSDHNLSVKHAWKKYTNYEKWK